MQLIYSVYSVSSLSTTTFVFPQLYPLSFCAYSNFKGQHFNGNKWSPAKLRFIFDILLHYISLAYYILAFKLLTQLDFRNRYVCTLSPWYRAWLVSCRLECSSGRSRGGEEKEGGPGLRTLLQFSSVQLTRVELCHHLRGHPRRFVLGLRYPTLHLSSLRLLSLVFLCIFTFGSCSFLCWLPDPENKIVSNGFLLCFIFASLSSFSSSCFLDILGIMFPVSGLRCAALLLTVPYATISAQSGPRPQRKKNQVNCT